MKVAIFHTPKDCRNLPLPCLSKLSYPLKIYLFCVRVTGLTAYDFTSCASGAGLSTPKGLLLARELLRPSQLFVWRAGELRRSFDAVPYQFIKLLEHIRFGRFSTPSEYQNIQLSWPHGITSVTGPRCYIKNVSLHYFLIM